MSLLSVHTGTKVSEPGFGLLSDNQNSGGQGEMRLIYIVAALLLLAQLPFAVSCGKADEGATLTGSPTPIQKSTVFKVGGGSYYKVNIVPPWDGARVEGTMQSNFNINFGIIDPQANTLSAYLEVTEANFSFVTTSRDTYKIYFDNTTSPGVSKIIHLNYTIY